MVSVAKGTTVAAGIGAAAGLASGYCTAKYLIKNKDLYQQGASIASGVAKELGKNANPVLKFLTKLNRKSLIDIRQMLNSGKISTKYMGKMALYGALFYGGAYLTYRGIKAGIQKIFSSNKAEKVA